MPSKTRVYNWFIAMVAASCMTLYGFDSSVFNALQASENWLNWFNLDLKNDSYTVGLINTCYTIGAIVSGFFIGGPLADWLGRRAGMGIGCFITIIAAIIQAFAPKGKLGVFILGRVLIGIGQGTALSTLYTLTSSCDWSLTSFQLLALFTSVRLPPLRFEVRS